MYTFEKNKLKNYLGKHLYESLVTYECIVAGGLITSLFCNRDINDVDIYFRNVESLKQFVKDELDGSQYWVVAKTKKALLIKYNNIEIQLICFNTFKNVEDLFNTFDFTCCMGAFDFATEEFILHENFLQHNSQRILMFNDKTSYPICSALRVKKYTDRGYTISKTEYLRILLTCMNLQITDYEQLKEQIGGMYGIDYDKILKPLESEEFDLAKVVSKMSELIYSEDYFENQYKTNSFEVKNWSALIIEILDTNVYHYKYGDIEFLYDKDNRSILKKNDFSEAFLEKHTVEGDFEEDFFTSHFYVYKNVRKIGNRFTSFYDNAFEYKLFETVKPTNEYSSQSSGIYCCLNEEDVSYNYERDACTIKLEVESPDDIKYMGESCIVLKKARFIQILKTEDITYGYY